MSGINPLNEEICKEYRRNDQTFFHLKVIFILDNNSANKILDLPILGSIT